MTANGYVAEREGFEPSVPRKRDNGFRDRPVRPLRHLSAELNSIRAKNKTDRNPDGATHRHSLLPIYFAAEFEEAAFDFPGRILAIFVNVFILSRSPSAYQRRR